MSRFKEVCLFLALRFLCSRCQDDYKVPEVTLEAYSPSGFRAAIKGEPQVELFIFHANLNKKISSTEPGEIGGEVKVNKSNPPNYVTFSQPQLRLKKGDVLHYWVYVQRNSLGYKKEEQKWEVTELREQGSSRCSDTSSRVSNKIELCGKTVIFEDNFDQSGLDTNKWLWEQYIPEEPDYEFVIYKKDPEITFVSGNQLTIKPKVIEDETELTRKTLDISEGCTRQGTACKRERFVRHNPVISGRIVTRVLFRYGEFEIRAKLPAGDWIFPEIYLEDSNNQKLFIAYARGNGQLVGNDGIDIGAKLLFGGPVLHPREPKRSEKLSSYRGNAPFTSDFHTYKLIWSPNQIELYVDGINYGLINTNSIKPSSFAGNDDILVKLVIGIGVGGLNDFPDGYKSGSYDKPWKNGAREMTKTFYNKKDEWHKGTWNSNSQLQIDYVKIKSL